MSWTVYISSKEKDAQQQVDRLVARGISAARRDLPLADVAFVHDGKTYVHAEFKTVADMVASIKDGRYRAQSAALEEAGVPYTFYMVHGLLMPGIDSTQQQSVQHALTRLQLTGNVSTTAATQRTHLSVVPISTPDGLHDWIVYVYENLVGDPSIADAVTAPLSDRIQHAYVAKKRVREQDEVFEEQMARLSGIGPKRARCITAACPTMTRLMETLHKSSSVKDLLQAIPGLGPQSAALLYTQMLAPDERAFDCDDCAAALRPRPHPRPRPRPRPRLVVQPSQVLP